MPGLLLPDFDAAQREHWKVAARAHEASGRNFAREGSQLSFEMEKESATSAASKAGLPLPNFDAAQWDCERQRHSEA